MRVFSRPVILRLVHQHPYVQDDRQFLEGGLHAGDLKAEKILKILRSGENARGTDNGEKDSDGLLSLFTLLTFLHSVSATGGLGGKRSGEVVGEKSLLFSLGFQSRPSLSGLLDRPVSSVHGGCHSGKTFLALHSC